ncbi:MAG: hypothetical protein WC716_16800 [Chitinophagaceae bacterium]|jgi:hypothetical protein
MAGKKAAAVAESPFWKGQTKGDSVEGKFLSWQKTQYGIAMKIETGKDKFKIIGLTTVLFNLLKEHWKQIKKGSSVKVVFEGKKKQANIYSAFINGKHLDSSMSFPEATGGDVADFFSKEYEFIGKGKSKRKK